MTNNPFFSIIVPTYNRAHLIKETIDTILAQEDTDFELLIIDDGSTDQTEEVVGTYTDLRIRYWKKENGERGAARNFGMKRARGQYALFFDSDDWMHKDHLAVIRQYLITVSRPCDFIATKYQFKDQNGKLANGATAHLASKEYCLADLLKGNMFGCLYTFNLKNKKLVYHEEDRGYAVVEDWMFLLGNLQFSNIHLIDKITITIRQHDERSMTNNARVIAAKQKATLWALQNIQMTHPQKRELQAYTNYFCAIHSYLDFKKREAISYIWKSIIKGGLRKDFAVLFFKTLIGKKLINKIK